ncbi:MAG: hypothetical protein V4585_15320 [Bacteroidota bacterium]
MNPLKFQKLSQKTFLLFILIQSSLIAFSQKTDSLKSKIQVSGAITVTNNGISVIPTFMLGKPATIFDLVVRKKNFSFEPQFRFAIEDAKPWSFIFWLRYKLIQTEKFKMGIGAHPSTVFSNTIGTVNGVSKDLITVKRYFAGELTPTYFISKNVSVGVYYLYSRGLADATKNTNFVALSSNFSNIKLTGEYYMKVSPQIYYLQMDNNEGFYITSAFTLAKNNFPLAISSVVNKKLQSTIPSEDFVWNVSLIYSY